MNYINFSDSNNLDTSSYNIGSVGTEYSDVDNNKFNSFVNKNNIFGGLLNDDFDDLAFGAAKKGEFAVLSYLVRENKIKDYKKQDKNNGYTILHYVIRNYEHIPKNKEVIDTILNNPGVNYFINAQDFTNGNTPLHLAIAQGNDEVAEKLITKGSDKTILNGNNEFIGTDNEQSINQPSNNQQYIKPKNMNQRTQQNINNQQYIKPNNINNNVKPNINNQQNIKPNINDQQYTNSNINIQQKSKPEEDIFIKKNSLNEKMKNIIDYFLKPKNNNETSQASLNMTDAMNELNTNKPLEQNEVNNTTDFIDNIISNFKQTGGDMNKNIISGKRTMKTLSDFQYDENYDDDNETTNENTNENENENENENVDENTDENNNYENNNNYGKNNRLQNRNYDSDEEYDTSKNNTSQSRNYDNRNKNYTNRSQSRNIDNQSNLNRLIQDKADDIHKGTIEKIKNLLGIDEEKAKVYKAALYNKVKTEHPELNNFDRAVEMEKIATTSNLKKINFDEWNEKIKKSRESKQSESNKKVNQTKPKPKSKTNELSESSLFSLKTDSNISTTSSYGY